MSDAGKATLNLTTIAACLVVLVPVIVWGTQSYSSIQSTQTELLDGQKDTKVWLTKVSDKVDSVNDKVGDVSEKLSGVSQQVNIQGAELAEHERQLDDLQRSVNKGNAQEKADAAAAAAQSSK